MRTRRARRRQARNLRDCPGRTSRARPSLRKPEPREVAMTVKRRVFAGILALMLLVFGYAVWINVNHDRQAERFEH